MKKDSPSTLGLLYRPTPALALESAGGHSSNHSIPLLFSRSKILGVAGPEPELAPELLPGDRAFPSKEVRS